MQRRSCLATFLCEVALATSEVTCPTNQVAQATSEVTCPKGPLQPRRLPGRNGSATSEVTGVTIDREVTISMRLNLGNSMLGRVARKTPLLVGPRPAVNPQRVDGPRRSERHLREKTGQPDNLASCNFKHKRQIASEILCRWPCPGNWKWCVRLTTSHWRPSGS